MSGPPTGPSTGPSTGTAIGPTMTSVLEGIPADARIVCVAGAVAVGKTTFSQHLADALTAAGRGPVEVVSTDGFLFRNHVLEARGLLERKGFPESYDVAALRSFARAVRSDSRSIPVPEYSHVAFDVVEGRAIQAPQLVILEGVNALQPDVAALGDVCVYVDAPEEVVIGWYIERFVTLTGHARANGAGFYTRFAHLDDGGVAVVARQVWVAINAPNLREHILPSRSHASIVVEKDADHHIANVSRLALRGPAS